MPSDEYEPGAGGLADLIANAALGETSGRASKQTEGTDRHQQLISTAKAAMALHETQAKVERGTKQKKGPMMEPPPKKA